MASSPSTAWAPGFSENPTGEVLSAKSIIEMLDLIGDELVSPPGCLADSAAPAPRITRRELLARVLWTRALLDADATATRLIIEYLDGKPGDAGSERGSLPSLCADDLAVATRLLYESLGRSHPSPA